MAEQERERPGLRERKKQQTRDALSVAAIRLTVERGWDAVTIEDVADAANVSVRTFRNYFGNKADAIAARHVDRIRRVADELVARPDHEHLWDAVTAAVRAQLLPDQPIEDKPVPGRDHAAAVQLMLSEPGLQGELAKAHAGAESVLATAVAERTGTNAARELYPHLVASSVTAALNVAMDHALRSDPPVPLGPLLDDALAGIRPACVSDDPAGRRP